VCVCVRMGPVRAGGWYEAGKPSANVVAGDAVRGVFDDDDIAVLAGVVLLASLCIVDTAGVVAAPALLRPVDRRGVEAGLRAPGLRLVHHRRAPSVDALATGVCAEVDAGEGSAAGGAGFV
jgi:hypothetical protein